MKKKILIIILFCRISFIFSHDIFSIDHFYLHMNAFTGTDYFPNREYKTTNYFDKQIYYAGWKYNLKKNVHAWLDITFNDKFYDKEIRLNSTGISYNKNSFRISYKFDKIKYGSDSKTFNILVKDRFYDYGVLENYRYNGVEILYSADNIEVKNIIAANDFHSIITSTSFQYKFDSISAELFYLFVGRNEEFNVKNHSFGLESSVTIFKTKFFLNSVYQYLPTHLKGDKLKCLFEITSNISDNLSLGTNLFFEKFVVESSLNWQSQSFVNFNFKKNKNYLIYRINRVEEFSSDYTNLEYSILSMYCFTDLFSMGINFSYFTPDFDQDFQQIGFQIEFNYEKDI